VLSGEFIKLSIDSPSFCPTYLSSFAEQEKEDHIDLTCDNILERNTYSVNPTNFWISLGRRHPFRYVVFLRSRIFHHGRY